MISVHTPVGKRHFDELAEERCVYVMM